jgi:hypothetical protein
MLASSPVTHLWVPCLYIPNEYKLADRRFDCLHNLFVLFIEPTE